MVTDVTIGLVDVQLGGREEAAVGLTCLKRAVNRGPIRREGARMKEMPAKSRTARRTSRNREKIARLEGFQASPPGVLEFTECSAVNVENSRYRGGYDLEPWMAARVRLRGWHFSCAWRQVDVHVTVCPLF